LLFLGILQLLRKCESTSCAVRGQSSTFYTSLLLRRWIRIIHIFSYFHGRP